MEPPVPDLSVDIDLEIRKEGKEGKEGLSPSTDISGTADPVYVVSLKPRPGTDGIKALRAALKVLGRRFGLRCVDIKQEEQQT